MAKFKIDDKVRVTRVGEFDTANGVKVGDVMIVDEDNSRCPFCLSQKGVPFRWSVMEEYLELVTDEFELGDIVKVKKSAYVYTNGCSIAKRKYPIGVVVGIAGDGIEVLSVDEVINDFKRGADIFSAAMHYEYSKDDLKLIRKANKE